MFTVKRVVDNRVFLLGLDFAYRETIKEHEREELLQCARAIAGALHVKPADVPIEGYYTESEQLTEYFRLVRALQNVDDKDAGAARSLPELKRLLEVTASPIFGRATYGGKLLPVGCDAMTQALNETVPEWTVANLTAAAHQAAIESDEISLVGLAARAKDPVVLAATRESVVLYSLGKIMGALRKPRYEYVWKVDADLAKQANRFIDAFNSLFEDKLPQAEVEQAEWYWESSNYNNILGRCVRLGSDDSSQPVRHYHWGIRFSGNKEFEVHDFWKPKVWTTERYRSALHSGNL